MSLIFDHLSKNLLHHAYLIEGERAEVLPEILEFIESLGVKIEGNADFSHISLDSFRVEDARNLKSFAAERSFSNKKIFLISANNFLLEAQNSLLKIFEEPIENTHFFLITPDTNSLIKTFVSRFYLIKNNRNASTTQAQEFIKMPLAKRLEFIGELLTEEAPTPEGVGVPTRFAKAPARRAESVGNEVSIASTRSKVLKFLNAVESVLHQKTFIKKDTQNFLMNCFTQIFKVREYLRMPGSSPKTLMESVALMIPNL